MKNHPRSHTEIQENSHFTTSERNWSVTLTSFAYRLSVSLVPGVFGRQDQEEMGAAEASPSQEKDSGARAVGQDGPAGN